MYLLGYLTGSTPRMRGISDMGIKFTKTSRFNPAYAGNMLDIRTKESLWQVQPRVCGEYSRTLACLFTVIGSTPRMRGI